MVSGQGRYPLTKVDVFLNDQFVGSSNPPAVSGFLHAERHGPVNEYNTLKAVGYDAVFNKGEAVGTLRLQFR